MLGNKKECTQAGAWEQGFKRYLGIRGINMRSRYKTYNQEGVFYVTSSIVNWINIFSEDIYFNILIDTFNFRRLKGEIKLFGYVIMPSHFHLIMHSINVSRAMQNIKSYTAAKIIEQLKRDLKFVILEMLKENKQEFKNDSTYQVWQEGFHPQLIISNKMLLQKLEYIHNNPIRAGLCEKAEDWKYSSARNYYLDKGLVEIDSFI